MAGFKKMPWIDEKQHKHKSSNADEQADLVSRNMMHRSVCDSSHSSNRFNDQIDGEGLRGKQRKRVTSTVLPETAVFKKQCSQCQSSDPKKCGCKIIRRWGVNTVTDVDIAEQFGTKPITKPDTDWNKKTGCWAELFENLIFGSIIASNDKNGSAKPCVYFPWQAVHHREIRVDLSDVDSDDGKEKKTITACQQRTLLEKTKPCICDPLCHKETYEKPNLSDIQVFGLGIVKNPSQLITPSVFQDREAVRWTDHTDTKSDQSDDKVGKDPFFPFFF